MSSVDQRSPHILNATKLPNPGPYIARIVNNVDPMKQGSLEVELMRPVGNQREAPQQLFVVRYLSPFYGVTNIDYTGSTPADFNDTQKSYGFWAVPPDVGCYVMVIFVEGDPGQGFWIGCVQDAYMNHMIPGIAASKATQEQSKDHDDTQWLKMASTQELYGDTFLPVGEINRREFKEGTEKGVSPNPDVDANKKPVHPIAKALLQQGTLHDPVRGVYTSSARRESPSNVYGWSTPGPRDKRNGAKKGKVGRRDEKIDAFVSRMGGHCIVMDDGDERFLRKTRPWEGPSEYADQEAGEQGLVNYPKDEAFRIRTRTGHQFLMHNSEDLIFLTNSRGTAWMEFTSNGKINFYAAEGIHFGSESDFTVHAARDVAMHAQRDSVHTSDATHVVEASNRISMNTPGHVNIEANGDAGVSAGNLLALNSAHGLDFSANLVNFGGNHQEWVLNGDILISAVGGNLEFRGQHILMTADSEMHFASGAGMLLGARSLDMIVGSNIVINSDSAISIKGEAVVLHGAGSLSARSDGSLAIQASTGNINLLSGSSILASAKAEIGIGTTGGNVNIAGDIIHLNGDKPSSAKNANIAPDAHMVVEAHYASSSLGGKSHVGGSYSTGAITSIRHVAPGVGNTPVKYVPTRLGIMNFENRYPPGQSPEYTDRHNPMQMHTKDEERYEVNHPSHYEQVASLAGGTSDGHINWASLRSGRRKKHNFDKSNDAKPSSAEAIEAYPKDWKKDQGYLSAVGELAGTLGVSRDEMLAVMDLESGHNPRRQNGSHTGLIQMGHKESAGVGTTTGKLMQMSRVEQMKYVKEYFSQRAKKNPPKDIAGVYMLVALPAWANKPETEPLATNDKKSKYYSYWHGNPAWRDSELPGNPVTRRAIKKAILGHVESVKQQINEGSIKSGGPSSSTSSNASSPTPSLPVGPTPGGINPR